MNGGHRARAQVVDQVAQNDAVGERLGQRRRRVRQLDFQPGFQLGFHEADRLNVVPQSPFFPADGEVGG